MREILIKNGERYIECIDDGCKVTFKRNDENIYDRETAKTPEHVRMLKRELRDMYDSYQDKSIGYDRVWDYMHGLNFHDKYFDGYGDSYCELRSRDEIEAYLEEATDKSWLAATIYEMKAKGLRLDDNERKIMADILKKYNDAPRNGYDTFESGYWTGVMAALRWVTGLEKDVIEV